MLKEQCPDFDWRLLKERAERVIDDTINELPENIKDNAKQIPCLFLNWSTEIHERDSLGLYDGFQPNMMPADGGRITIFLGNIFRVSDLNITEFDSQIRVTYLHELGHHLGWNELELEERGLQ